MDSIINDPVLEEKVRKAKERISENMHILANEPSLAYYRLQENIRKSMPPMVEKRIEAEKVQKDLQGSLYDLEYAIGEINSMIKTIPTFENILNLTRSAVYFKQQLKYLNAKKPKKEKPSIRKRFSVAFDAQSDRADAKRSNAKDDKDSKDGGRPNLANQRHSNLY